LGYSRDWLLRLERGEGKSLFLFDHGPIVFKLVCMIMIIILPPSLFIDERSCTVELTVYRLDGNLRATVLVQVSKIGKSGAVRYIPCESSGPKPSP
jgi:hypothetical protein